MTLHIFRGVRLVLDDGWQEKKHPRKKNGEFGRGGVPNGGTPHAAPGSGSASSKLTATKKRAYSGEPVELKTKLSKQESGAIGEAIVIAFLKNQGIPDSRALNLKTNNFPVDLIGDHQLVEVKTGLVSNGASAQKWRATIGQPGKKETEWLKTLDPVAKADWNKAKAKAIMDRKKAVLRAYSKNLGKPVKARTVTVLLNPDTKTADVYSFAGFHHSIRWNSEQGKAGYVGSYKYE